MGHLNAATTRKSSTALVWPVALPIAFILIGHFAVDTYSSLVPPLLGVIQTQFGMTDYLTAIMFGTGALCSGLAQPVFAFLSDRLNSRVFGGLGLVLGAVFICLLGRATSVSILFISYCIGMMGIGMFHPIAASTIGRLAGSRRNLAISWFFVFGMAGWFSGSIAGPEIATGTGNLNSLSYLILPGLVIAAVLQILIRGIPHNAHATSGQRASMSNYSWVSIAFLYLASAMRFMVNLALVYLIVRWMEADVRAANPDWTAEQVSDHAAPFIGRMNATLNVGMATGGLLAGFVIPLGKERLPIIWIPMIFSPAVMAFAFCDPGWLGMLCGFLAGIGFASMVPVSISLGQRLMPHHTSLGSGLMLGGAWALGCLGPGIAEFVLQQSGLKSAFLTIGGLLAASGLVALGIRQSAISAAAKT